MTRETFSSLVTSIIPKLDNKYYQLIFGIAYTESGLDESTSRYEAGWKCCVNVSSYAKSLRITDSTERIHQNTSWGLMQIMGGVARRLGYKGHLPALIYPAHNLHYGWQFLEELLAKYVGLDDVISAYNAGHPAKLKDLYLNQHYVDTVKKHMGEL